MPRPLFHVKNSTASCLEPTVAMGSAWLFVGIALVAILLLVGCTRTIDESQLFFPQPQIEPEPVDDRELITVPIDDSTAVRGWRVASPGSRYTLFYFYGNGESVVTTDARMEWLASTFGIDVVCIDYRGYGFSDGTPGVDAILEDAVRAYDAVVDTAGTRVIVFGRSIGTAPALHLAASRPVDALILEAPFPSIRAVVKAWDRNIPPPMGWFVRLRPSKQLANRTPQPIDLIQAFNGPLLVIHGDDDTVIPQALGSEMFDAAPSGGKTWCPVPRTGHNNLSLTHPGAEPTLREFMEDVTGE